MIDLLLQNGDLVADKYGDITLCADEDNDIIQMANNNMLLRLGSNKFHTQLGNGIYNKRIKANQNGIDMVRSECVTAIMNSDSRIRKVKQINVTLAEDASCIVDYILIYARSDTSELVEINGRTHVDAFNNMKGGE